MNFFTVLLLVVSGVFSVVVFVEIFEMKRIMEMGKSKSIVEMKKFNQRSKLRGEYWKKQYAKIWSGIRSFFRKKEKVSKEADAIAAEFGRKILREVRELGGDENDLELHRNFALQREIARTVLRNRKLSVETERSPNTIRQGDFVQVDNGVSVFPDCETVNFQPAMADKKMKI